MGMEKKGLYILPGKKDWRNLLKEVSNSSPHISSLTYNASLLKGSKLISRDFGWHSETNVKYALSVFYFFIFIFLHE